MPITLGNNSSNDALSGASIDTTHTNEVGDGRVIIAEAAFEGSGETITSVVYDPGGGDEIAFTQAIQAQEPSNFQSAAIFYLPADVLPTTGTRTIRATFSASGSSSLWVDTHLGMSQGAPEDTSSDSDSLGANVISSVTTVADGAWVIESFCGNTEDTITWNSGQTERLVLTGNIALTHGVSYRTISPAGSATMDTTFGVSTRIVHVIASFAPTATATGGAPSFTSLRSTRPPEEQEERRRRRSVF